MRRWWMAMVVGSLTACLPMRAAAQFPPGAGGMPPGYGPPAYGAPPPGYGPGPMGAVPPPAFGPPGAMPGQAMPGMPTPPGAPPGSGEPGEGSEDPMTLSHIGPTAFEVNGNPQSGFFMSVGTKAYHRQGLPALPVGVVDGGVPATQTTTVTSPVTFNTRGNPVTVNTPVQVQYDTVTFPDTGNPPVAKQPLIGSFQDASPGLEWGASGTIGYRFDRFSVEITGFYIPNNGASSTDLLSTNLPVPVPIKVNSVVSVNNPLTDKNATVVDLSGLPNAIGNQATMNGRPANSQAGRLDLPFFNAPPGFEGNNNLWLQADHVNVSFRNSLGDVETNYRYSPSEQIQLLAGLRYVDEREELGIFTQDDSIIGPPNAANDATYRVVTHNRIVVGQLGVQGEWPLCKFLDVGVFATGGAGGNFLSSNLSLTRGDGLVGFNATRQANVFSQVYEMGAFLDLYCGERCRLHAGYNLFWLRGLAEAVQQIDYNLSNTTGMPNNSGSVFFHGPCVELQFMF